MFNLIDDPQERNDLWNDPKCAAKRMELLKLHVRAYMRPLATYPYRNLPVENGVRYTLGVGLGKLKPLC